MTARVGSASRTFWSVSSAIGVLVLVFVESVLDDTVRDLLFDSVGALVVAVFGQTHLTDVAERLRERLSRPE